MVTCINSSNWNFLFGFSTTVLQMFIKMLVSKDNFYDYIQVLLLNEKLKNNPPWNDTWKGTNYAILQLFSF